MAEEIFTEQKFDVLEIKKDLYRGIMKLGFEQMTPIQAQAIPVLLDGRDVIGQAQTGTGKTAAYGIPLLEQIDPLNKNLQAIVLCPTRELAIQVAQELRGFAAYMQDIKLLPIYGGQDIRRQILGLRGTQIVVGTPGRIMDHMRRHTIKMKDVKLCILDEADEMLKMGFREDMEVILGEIEHPHQTCLFSATMPKEILALTKQFQDNAEIIKIAAKELTMERITQYYYPVKSEYKTQALVRLISCYGYKKSIIFCNTKAMTEELVRQLAEAGYSAEALHGDLNQRQRDTVMDHFRTGRVENLIATDIAARGLDIDDVEAVFNYDIPKEAEHYVHRIGRTGRAGRVGISHTLCKSREFGRIREIERICNSQMIEKQIPSLREINQSKLKVCLDEVITILSSMNESEEHSVETYLNLIQKYCIKYEVGAEEIAAILLRKEVSTLDEDVDLNLSTEKGRRSGRAGRRGDRGERRDERFGKDGRGDRFRGERKERREEFAHGEKKGRNEGRANGAYSAGSEDFARRGERRDKKRDERPRSEKKRKKHDHSGEGGTRKRSSRSEKNSKKVFGKF